MLGLLDSTRSSPEVRPGRAERPDADAATSGRVGSRNANYTSTATRPLARLVVVVEMHTKLMEAVSPDSRVNVNLTGLSVPARRRPKAS